MSDRRNKHRRKVRNLKTESRRSHHPEREGDDLLKKTHHFVRKPRYLVDSSNREGKTQSLLYIFTNEKVMVKLIYEET